MTAPKLNWEISLGTLLHLFVLMLGLAAAYGSFVVKFDALAGTVADTRKQTTRIEHYLNAQDKDYWRKIAANGDADGK